MKATFKCKVCGEKLTLTGTPDGIENAKRMWLIGHEHLIPVTSTDPQCQRQIALELTEGV